MKTRFKLEILNVVFGFAALVTPLFAQDPVVSVTVKNLETFGEKISAMAEDVGDQGTGLAALTFQSFISQPSFTEAIDSTRPVGLFLIPTGPKDPVGVAVVPVKDVEKALKLLPSGKFVTEKKGENSWEVSKKTDEEENPQKLVACVEQQGDWCFLQSAKMDVSVKDVAQKLVQSLTAPKDSDFQITFNVNAVPQKDRQKFVAKAVKKAKKKLEKEREDGTQNELVDFCLAEVEKFADSAEHHNWESPIEQISLGYTWDEDARKLVIRNAFTGCKDAHQVEALSRTTRATSSALNGFGTEGTLASFHVNVTIPQMNEQTVKNLLEAHYHHGKARLQKEIGEEEANKIADFVLKNGELFRCAFVGAEQEVAGAIYAERGKKLTFIYGRSVPDGYALEKTFRQAVKYVAEKKADDYRKYVKNDSCSERGEFHIYQADFVPKEELPAEMKEIFPETIPGCVIFTPNGVFGALGMDAVETLLQNIQTAKTADAPAFAARISLANALNVWNKATNEQKEKLEKVGDAEATVQVVSREDGAEIVTEIPAQFFKAMKILEKK